MGKCCPVYKTALVLIVVGALNWGLVGAFNFDLVQFLFTQNLGMPMVANIVYIVVGVAGVYAAFNLLTCCGDSCKK